MTEQEKPLKEQEKLAESTEQMIKETSGQDDIFVTEKGEECDLSGIDRDLYGIAIQDLLDKSEEIDAEGGNKEGGSKAASTPCTPDFIFPDIFCPEGYDITLESRQIAIAAEGYKSGENPVRYQIGTLVDKEVSEEGAPSGIKTRCSVDIDPECECRFPSDLRSMPDVSDLQTMLPISR